MPGNALTDARPSQAVALRGFPERSLTNKPRGGCLGGFMNILIGILTFVLILVAIFLVLVVLIQKPRADSGLGAAMGGGAAEAAFGAETGNVLTRATIVSAIAFFVLSFVLYLGHLYVRNHSRGDDVALPEAPAFSAPAEAIPATPEPVGASPAVPAP